MRHLLLATLFLAPTIGLAQYKCVVDGKTLYAERPCAPGAKAVTLPRDNLVTPDERDEAKARVARQTRVAEEIAALNAAEQAKVDRRAEAIAAAEKRKTERCASLLRTAQGAQNEAQKYRYHQGLIDDALRRRREAEAAHFSECYGTVR